MKGHYFQSAAWLDVVERSRNIPKLERQSRGPGVVARAMARCECEKARAGLRVAKMKGAS